MTHVLTEQQRRLYSRQVLLRELGQAGQARLCAAEVAAADGGDPAATTIALDYLQRAGLQLRAAGEAVTVASAEAVDHSAADPALRGCAEWLHGAWAAVETIKRCAGVGSPARSTPPALASEVD